MSFRTIYTSELYTEAQPYYRFELDGRAVPHEIMRRVTNLVLREECGMRGQVSFSLRASRLHDLPMFELNQQLVVYAGYREEFEMRGPFGINSVVETYPDRDVVYQIKGEEASKFSDTGSRRVFRHGSLLDLFKRVAANHGLEVVTEGLENVDIAIDDEYPIVQAGENDGVFLQRVAKEFGWLMTAMDGKIHLTGPVAREALGVIELHYGNPVSNMASVRVTRKKPRVKYDKVDTPTRLSEIQPVVSSIRQLLVAGHAHNPQAALLLQTMGLTAEAALVTGSTFGESTVRWAEGILHKQDEPDPKPSGTGRIEMKLPELDPAITEVSDRIKEALGENDGLTIRGGDLDDVVGLAKRAVMEAKRDPNDRVFFDGGTDPHAFLEEVKRDAAAAGIPPEILDSGLMLGAADKHDEVKRTGKATLMTGMVEKLETDLHLGTMRFRPQGRVVVKNLGPRIDGEYRVHATVNDFTRGFKTTLELRAGWLKKKTLGDALEGVDRNTLIGVVAGATMFNPAISAAAVGLTRSGVAIADAVGKGALREVYDAAVRGGEDATKAAAHRVVSAVSIDSSGKVRFNNRGDGRPVFLDSNGKVIFRDDS